MKVCTTVADVPVTMVYEETDLLDGETLAAYRRRLASNRHRRLPGWFRLIRRDAFLGCLSNDEIDRLDG